MKNQKAKTTKDIISESITEYQNEIDRLEKKIMRLKELQGVRMTTIARDVLYDMSVKHWVWVFEIKWKVRTTEIMKPRREFVRIMKDKYGYTYEMIGNILNRNHASIMYLYKND